MQMHRCSAWSKAQRKNVVQLVIREEGAMVRGCRGFMRRKWERELRGESLTSKSPKEDQRLVLQ